MTYPFPNSNAELGQIHFRLYYGEVLRQALQKARDGELDHRWRQNTAHSSVLSGLVTGADPYGVHAAVVTAINEMPSAAWEPGHSPGWRAALDSWFDAARAALIEHRTMSLAQHATSAKLGASMPVAARVAASPSVIDAIALITRSDAMNDQTARQSLSTFMVQRDMLTASYMAALCAGGVNVDWRPWLGDRIKYWDNSMAAENARSTMRQDHSYLERLPPYW